VTVSVSLDEAENFRRRANPAADDAQIMVNGGEVNFAPTAKSGQIHAEL
jgi:hypothetical protein